MFNSDKLNNPFYDTTTLGVTTDTWASISITPPSGYTRGVLIGLQGSRNSNSITLQTIGASAYQLDFVRVKSTEAQTIYVRTMWFE